MPLASGTGDTEAAAARASTALAGEVVENLGVLVFRRVLSPEGVVSYPCLSAGAEALFGVPPARFRALAAAGEIGGVMHKEDRPAWAAAIAQSAATLSPLSFEGRVVRPDGSEWWVRVTAPVRREPGGATVWDGIALDATDQKAAEQERARLASIVDASADAIYSWSIDGTIISWNPEAERLFGYQASEAIGRSFLMLVPPERDMSAERAMRELAEGCVFRQFETVRLHRDGRRIEVSLTVSPLRDASGRIVAVSTIARDISRRRAAEAALKLSEERFRTTLSSIGDAVVATDREARVSFLNPVAEELTGWHAAEAEGRQVSEVFRIVDETTRAPVENPVARVFAGKGVAGLTNHTLLVRRDGREVPIADSAAPILDAGGAIVGAVLVFRDVTEQRAHETQRELLVRELDHRVKNTLALAQSILRQTARGAASVADLKTALEGRLQAMASAHSLLVRSGWREAALDELVREVLAPHPGIGEPGRLVVSGPPVPLSPATVSTIAMVLHELGTNAAKYGALSVPEGRVEIGWRLSPGVAGPRIELDWRESGGPPVTPPARKGFGSMMIERAVVQQLRGEAQMRYEAAGVTCRLALPVTTRTAGEAAKAAV